MVTSANVAGQICLEIAAEEGLSLYHDGFAWGSNDSAIYHTNGGYNGWAYADYLNRIGATP